MKILVTGGAGFVARNLLENLNNKYTLFTPNSHELNLLDSVRVADCLKKNKFDVIIHTATYDAVARFTTKDSNKVLESNLKMFFNLTRCKNYFGKMIYFGSGAEYNREYWIPKMKEDYFDTHVPTDQYGFSKYLMTKYTLLNNNIYNLRLFGIFGRYDDWRTRPIPNICCQAVMDSPIKIEQNKYRDFLYADDLVKVVDWFLTHTPKKRVYNICTGKIYNYKNIAEKIIKISGKKLNLKIEKKGLGQEYSGDNTRLLNEIKGFKFISIDESLKALYKWYSLNKKIIDVDKL